MVARDTILKSNPLGKVPCLVMDGAEAVFDSRVIVEYVDTLSPVGRLIPERGRERTEVRTWEALGDGVIDAADPRPASSALGPAAPTSSAARPGSSARWSRSRLLAAMSQGLAEKPFCTGIHFSLADVAAGCALATSISASRNRVGATSTRTSRS